MVMPARAADAQGQRCAATAGGEAVRAGLQHGNRSLKMAVDAIDSSINFVGLDPARTSGPKRLCTGDNSESQRNTKLNPPRYHPPPLSSWCLFSSTVQRLPAKVAAARHDTAKPQ